MPRTRESKAHLKPGFVLVLQLLGLAGYVSIAMAQSTGSFAATGDMTMPRGSHTATLLTNGKVLIAGGASLDGSVIASAELYDPVSGTFTPTGDMSTARRGHSATQLADGSVLIAGGYGGPGTFTPSAERYDPSTGIFTATGDITTARGFHSAVLLANGKVLIAGGGPAELYDPFTGAFAATGTYAGRYAPQPWAMDPPYVYASTLLADGRVLIAASTGFEARKELYDPGGGTFSLISPSGCGSTTAILLTNGKILFAGADGIDIGCFFNGAELYDPSTGTITATGNMTMLRYGFTATLVPNGTVLIAGGQQQYPSALPSAELYDPATGTFSAIGNMTVPRFMHTATLLLDGRVLIAGGSSDASDVTSSAELYVPASPMAVAVPYQGAILSAVDSTSRVAE